MLENTAPYPVIHRSSSEIKQLVFRKAELNGPVIESLFAFIEPSDAKLIQDFPDPRQNFGGVSTTGDQVLPLKLKSVDGQVVALDSFRGKPVVLDFWATWCGPCVEAQPQLARINSEAEDKGLVLLAVDQDEEETRKRRRTFVLLQCRSKPRSTFEE
jgi:thiol-disulfide isomerase/thioredoxin